MERKERQKIDEIKEEARGVKIIDYDKYSDNGTKETVTLIIILLVYGLMGGVIGYLIATGGLNG